MIEADERPRAMVTRGAVAFLVCLVGFGLIAWLVSQPGIPPIDTATTGFLHGLASPTVDSLMDAPTFLGSSPVLAAVAGVAIVLLVARRRRVEAVFIVVALVGTLVLNDGLKLLVQRPRPVFDCAEVWPETGFPSGHSMNSFVVYLAIALVIWRLAGRRVGIVVLVLAILLAISVGISWIYLGATGSPTSSGATWPGRCGCCSGSLRGPLSHGCAEGVAATPRPGIGKCGPCCPDPLGDADGRGR